MSNRCLNFTVPEKLFFKNLPGTRRPPGLCPPCLPHCYATAPHQNRQQVNDTWPLSCYARYPNKNKWL